MARIVADESRAMTAMERNALRPLSAVSGHDKGRFVPLVLVVH
jgi:hypothetical protein